MLVGEMPGKVKGNGIPDGLLEEIRRGETYEMKDCLVEAYKLSQTSTALLL